MVLKLIQPYTRIRIPFVSQQLNIPEYDVEQLLVALILDNRIQGHIDQVMHFGGWLTSFISSLQCSVSISMSPGGVVTHINAC